MAHSCFINIQQAEKQQLLSIAGSSIDNGLAKNCPLEIVDRDYRGVLLEPLGVFVTLTKNDQLRGCMGCLETSEPLVKSVSSCAYNAAFRDPRFPRLTAEERSLIDIDISILSPMELLSVNSREDLLNQLEPDIDGLLLEDGYHRSTFLPKVWESLRSPQDFLQHLLLKAGLPADYWSDNMRFSRYRTISFHD